MALGRVVFEFLFGYFLGKFFNVLYFSLFVCNVGITIRVYVVACRIMSGSVVRSFWFRVSLINGRCWFYLGFFWFGVIEIKFK